MGGDYSRLEQVFHRVRVCFIQTITSPGPEQGLDNSLLICFAADKSYERVPQIFVPRCLFPEYRGAIGHVLEGPDGFPVEVVFKPRPGD